MVSLLQACVTIEEVQSVIGRLARELFATDSGALYLINSHRKLLEPVALWGENRPGEQGLQARECWSLRLGKMYMLDSSHAGVLCSHVKQPLKTASLCIPLMAQGETLGLLHVLFNPGWLELPFDARERQKRHKQQLAIAVAENIALSLANFKLRDTLYIQSIHDYLTGLYNRRYMAELLEKELHRMARKRQHAGVVIIDIDRFKGINDRFGHEAGDIVLREFSLFLRKNIREEDFACRYGGDEFVIILPETSLENTRQRAEQLREGIKSLNFQFRGNALDNVTLSLGVAVYPNHGLTAEALLRTADTALYRAKADGRDRVVTL
jgi:diguanylate cyclase (GGDEF)-like protein